MNRGDNSVDRETLLAEFAALRAEILQRSSILWNVFALQLTAAGVVFSFALANRSHIGFLLILPVITYALSGRYATQMLGTETIGDYIRDILDRKANGELNWEAWKGSRIVNERNLTWLNPLFLVFPGVAVAALVFVAPYVWTSHHISTGQHVLITVIWWADLLVTLLSFKLIARVVCRPPRKLAIKANKGAGCSVHDSNKPLSGQIQALEQCLAGLERLLGCDNPSTVRTRDGLAGAYLEAGRAADAIPVFERIYEYWKRVLGPYHPETLRVWDNLVDARANAYLADGRVAEAIQVFERNLASREQAFGSDHPYTLRPREKLANAHLVTCGPG